MMIYLCTCGTSAAKEWPKEEYGRFSTETIAQHGGKNWAVNLLCKHLCQFSMQNDQHLAKHLSAEIHSLARMEVNTTDTVILLSSETLDGQVCAEAVARYLTVNGLDVKVDTIAGLQVQDARKFSKVGVVAYLRKLLQYIDGHGNGQCVLNPTGGFKALVPYTVLLGMLRQVTCRYIFEFSSQLIDLPPLPVEFSKASLNAVRPVLEQIERDSAINIKVFSETLSREQRQSLEVLFDVDDPNVTLSAVGFLVLEELQKPSALIPYLSQEAMSGLRKLRARSDVNPLEYLERIARHPDKLSKDKHGNAEAGLFWLKPGNTTDRYLASIEDDWKLLVWEMHGHEDYEERSGVSGLGKAVRNERTRRYAPFFRMEILD